MRSSPIPRSNSRARYHAALLLCPMPARVAGRTGREQAATLQLTDIRQHRIDMAMQSVLETSIFTRRADALLSREDRNRLILTLATEHQAGDLVPGLGGIRKLRFAAGGQGKRGAFRVIYYVAQPDRPVLALLIYGKNEQANPTPEQRRAMLAMIEGIKIVRRA